MVLIGMDPTGTTLVTQCEDRCADQFPNSWQYHLFMGCIVGCNPKSVIDEQIDNVDKVVCATVIVIDVVTVPSG